MTAAQLQRLLDKMGETQVGMARKLDISDRNMRRYVSGELPIPLVVELAATCLLEHQSNGEDREPLAPIRAISLTTPPKNAPSAGANACVRDGKVFVDQSPVFGLSRNEVIRLRDWLNKVLAG